MTSRMNMPALVALLMLALASPRVVAAQRAGGMRDGMQQMQGQMGRQMEEMQKYMGTMAAGMEKLLQSMERTSKRMGIPPSKP
ncbi:MAG TPA: hypothetical protein VIK50_09705 [Gemmatimonadaceae bacterium]